MALRTRGGLTGVVTAAAVSLSAQGGSILYVDDDANAGGDGLSWETAYRFLQDALIHADDHVNTVCEIRVAQGIYRPDRDEANPEGTGDRDSEFRLDNGLVVLGGYAGLTGRDPDVLDIEEYETILCGDLAGDDGDDFENNDENSLHVVRIYGTGGRLEGFTIRNGHANGGGGDSNGAGLKSTSATGFIVRLCRFTSNDCDNFAAALELADSFVDNCIFVGNRAGISGGAVGAGAATFVDCTFEANSAFEGGAVSIGGEELFAGCVFRGNTAVRGGAVFVTSNDPVFARCTFIDNVATGINDVLRGGGAIVAENPFKAYDCYFLSNQADVGGAIAGFNRIYVLANCVFQNNVAKEFGGATFFDDCDESLILNSTMSLNIAGISGGGHFNTGGIFDGMDLVNCVLWNNSDATGTTESAQIFILKGPVFVNYCCVQGLTGGLGGNGNIGAPPRFVDVDGDDDVLGNEDDNLRLRPTSPCIDGGDTNPLIACLLDPDGNLRRFDDPNTRDTGIGKAPIVDMGAFEFGGPEQADCNGNGMDDVCELEGGFTSDCNRNGEPDSCDLRDGVSVDCNGNWVPDDCDIAEGVSADCNGNGVPDECDLRAGFSLDCNFNDVPDECDISSGLSVDCNANDVPDECDLSNDDADCNQNQVLDSCELADGGAQDCNRNGLLDECDLAHEFFFDSGILSPFHEFFWQSADISPAPPALGDVILTISAVADVGFDGEEVDVVLNGELIDSVFGDTNHDCANPPDEETLTVSADLFNRLVDGTALIELIPADGVDDVCDGGYIRVVVVYEREPGSADSDGDGIPDECEVFADLDNDGIVGATDLIILLGAWGLCPAPPEVCPADLSNDGVVGTTDLLILLGNWG